MRSSKGLMWLLRGMFPVLVVPSKSLFPSSQIWTTGGIGVVAVKNGLDTSSSTGKMMMKMIGVMEEWNREMLVERTKSGLARTRANGTKLGRKKITTPRMTTQIISLRNENKSIRAIATMVGVSTATIQRELRKVA
jgi:DNA invertase Pin-like site-specific DNA recombinase